MAETLRKQNLLQFIQLRMRGCKEEAELAKPEGALCSQLEEFSMKDPRIHYSSFYVLHNVHNKRGGGGQNRVFQDNYKEPSVEYLSAAKKKKCILGERVLLKNR